MSKKDAPASSEEQGVQEVDSVYDFLYHDSRRIGSFLAQFDRNGLLTGLRHSDSATKGSRRGWKVGLGGQAPLIGGANIDLERAPAETGSETLERSYDPFWTNAREFLDAVTERNLLQRTLEEATYGQFVLATGWLSVMDLAMFKGAWALKSIQKVIRKGATPTPQGNRQERRAAGATSGNAGSEDVDLMLELMTILPHSVHASILTSDAATKSVWGALREEFLVTPASELTATHGTSIPGEWTMIGILNARPDFGLQNGAPNAGDLPHGLVDSVVGRAVQTLAPVIRLTLGRPGNSYAVTPLLIFREVLGG